MEPDEHIEYRQLTKKYARSKALAHSDPYRAEHELARKANKDAWYQRNKVRLKAKRMGLA